MTLLVADDDARSLPPPLAADSVTISSDAVSDAVDANDPAVVVVDGPSVPDAAEVVRAVRGASPQPAIVVVGDEAGEADLDQVDADDSSIMSAVERAQRVAAYRRSVSDLYDAARDRARGRPDADLRARRRRADDCFSDLPADEETFAALLRTDPEDVTGAPDEEDGDG